MNFDSRIFGGNTNSDWDYYRIRSWGEKPQEKLPEKYIINKDACILFWEYGDKTIVKKSKDDKFNKRLAFLTAYFQHQSGLSKTKANKYLDNLIVLDEEETTSDCESNDCESNTKRRAIKRKA